VRGFVRFDLHGWMRGRFSLDFQARDCITDNIAGRTISAVPIVGDWAMLNWGCSDPAPMIGE
jgi:hypothetical protein